MNKYAHMRPLDRTNLLPTRRPLVQHRMCSRKTRWSTFEKAEQAVERAIKAGNAEKGRVYSCPYCFGYHWTSQVQTGVN